MFLLHKCSYSYPVAKLVTDCGLFSYNSIRCLGVNNVVEFIYEVACSVIVHVGYTAFRCWECVGWIEHRRILNYE